MEARAVPPDSDPEDFYHAHEEVNVPVTGEHDHIADYLRDALSVYLPGHWVAEDRCCYWIRGNNQVFLGPDVFVAEGDEPVPSPRSYRSWEHGPLLLVVEIGSRSSFGQDVAPKLERYAEGLRPEEYLYFDADRGLLTLHRRTDLGYIPITADPEGKLWSQATGAGFAIEREAFLRAYDSDGNPLPSTIEQAELRRLAEHRADEERLRADEERRKAETALERVAALEAELARLRRAG